MVGLPFFHQSIGSPALVTWTLIVKRSTKSGGLPLLTRLQNRACTFPFTRLLSGAAPVMSTIKPTGLGDALSALHTYLGQAGFMSYACVLVPLPSTPPLSRQRILGITPGLGFLGDPAS